MGGPRDPVWEYYNRHPIGKYHYGKCLVCGTHVAGKPHLLLLRLPVCINQPAEVRSWARKNWDELTQNNRRKNVKQKPTTSTDTKDKQARLMVESFPSVTNGEQVRLLTHIMRFLAA